MLESLVKKYLFGRNPLALNIYLTYKCNDACSSCRVRQDKSPELSTDEWKSIIKQYSKKGVRLVTLEGGEPTLRKDLPEIIDYCSSLDLRTILVTNCSNDLAPYNPTVFWASLDGINGNDDSIRGKGHFDRVRQRVYDNPDKNIALLMTINKKNKEDIIPLLNTFENNQVLFNFYYDFQSSNELALTKEEKLEIADKLIYLKKEGYKVFNTTKGISRIGKEKPCYPHLIKTINPMGKEVDGCFIELFEDDCNCNQCDLACYIELTTFYELDKEALSTWNAHLSLGLPLREGSLSR